MNTKVLLPLSLILIFNACSSSKYITCSDLSVFHYTNQVKKYCSQNDRTNEECKQRIKREYINDYNSTLNSFFRPFAYEAYRLDQATKKKKKVNAHYPFSKYINVSPYCQQLGTDIEHILKSNRKNKYGYILGLKQNKIQDALKKEVIPINPIIYTAPTRNLKSCHDLYKKIVDFQSFNDTSGREYKFIVKKYNELKCSGRKK